MGDIPRVGELGGENFDAEKFVAAHKAQMDFLENAERMPIGLPCDGETFNDPTLEEFRDRLAGLKAMGYNVPGWVFETIDDEIKEQG